MSGGISQLILLVGASQFHFTLYILGVGREEVEGVGEAPDKVAGERFLEGRHLRD